MVGAAKDLIDSIAVISDIGPYHNGAKHFLGTMKISVNCKSGYRVDEKPTSIRFDSLVVNVDAIEDQWLDPDYRYFKCLGSDRATYIIRQDMDSLDWELTYYRQHRQSDA
jgi:hypothetical protein